MQTKDGRYIAWFSDRDDSDDASFGHRPRFLRVVQAMPTPVDHACPWLTEVSDNGEDWRKPCLGDFEQAVSEMGN